MGFSKNHFSSCHRECALTRASESSQSFQRCKGSLAYNQPLSERRALAVKRELIRQGVPAARLNSAGKGMSELLNANDPYASENRRVEIRTGN